VTELVDSQLFQRRLSRLIADGALPRPTRGKKMAAKKAAPTALSNVSNDAAADIQMGVPYQVEIVLAGADADLRDGEQSLVAPLFLGSSAAIVGGTVFVGSQSVYGQT